VTSGSGERRAALLLGIAPSLAEGPGRDALRARFSRLAGALSPMGIDFAYREVGSPGELDGALSEIRPDLAFSALASLSSRASQSSRGVDVLEALQRAGVPCVGSAPGVVALTRSKSRMKRVLEARGVATPSWVVVRRARTGSISGRKALGAARDYPYIVKPDGEDEGRGIRAKSIAFDAGGLASSVEASLAEYDELIIERFAGGPSSREYTVAMIGGGEGALMLPAEIVLGKPRPIRVVTSEDRDSGLAVARPVADPAERDRIGSFARRAFEAAGVRDYARCDLIDKGGELLALEVNAMPRMPDPWFDACASGAGLSPGQCAEAVVLAAVMREFRGREVLGQLIAATRPLIPEPVFALLSS